jgi:hypothetical protein
VDARRERRMAHRRARAKLVARELQGPPSAAMSLELRSPLIVGVPSEKGRNGGPSRPKTPVPGKGPDPYGIATGDCESLSRFFKHHHQPRVYRTRTRRPTIPNSPSVGAPVSVLGQLGLPGTGRPKGHSWKKPTHGVLSGPIVME